MRQRYRRRPVRAWPSQRLTRFADADVGPRRNSRQPRKSPRAGIAAGRLHSRHREAPPARKPATGVRAAPPTARRGHARQSLRGSRRTLQLARKKSDRRQARHFRSHVLPGGGFIRRGSRRRVTFVTATVALVVALLGRPIGAGSRRCVMRSPGIMVPMPVLMTIIFGVRIALADQPGQFCERIACRLTRVIPRQRVAAAVAAEIVINQRTQSPILAFDPLVLAPALAAP